MLNMQHKTGVLIEKNRITICETRLAGRLDKTQYISFPHQNKQQLHDILCRQKPTTRRSQVMIGIDSTFYQHDTLSLPNRLSRKEINHYIVSYVDKQRQQQNHQYYFTFTYYTGNKHCHINLYLCPIIDIEEIIQLTSHKHWRLQSIAPAITALPYLINKTARQPCCILLGKEENKSNYYFYYRRHLIATGEQTELTQNPDSPVHEFFRKNNQLSTLIIVTLKPESVPNIKFGRYIKLRHHTTPEHLTALKNYQLTALSLTKQC